MHETRLCKVEFEELKHMRTRTHCLYVAPDRDVCPGRTQVPEIVIFDQTIHQEKSCVYTDELWNKAMKDSFVCSCASICCSQQTDLDRIVVLIINHHQ